MNIRIVAVAVTVIFLFLTAPVARGVPKASNGTCSGFVDRADLEIRLWTDYYFRAGIRWGYYSHPANSVTRALFQRYYAGQARNLVEGHLRRGKGQPDANRPSVRIISIKVSSTEDCAELTTIETWFLTRGGKVVFRETNKRHTVFLEKSSTLGGRWVVTRIT